LVLAKQAVNKRRGGMAFENVTDDMLGRTKQVRNDKVTP
jgi:hypothetical protein